MKMVKEIEYFIEYERQFKKEHPDYGQTFYDDAIGEMSEIGIDDRMNYLADGIFAKVLETIDKPVGREIEFGLTVAERVVFRLFHGRHSCIFKDYYYYEGINDFLTNLFDTLDSVVQKAPINRDAVLYRYCKNDPNDMQVGEHISIPYNLTCTNYEWYQDKNHDVYVIIPLQDDSTRAHNLYEIYPHGDEHQVDFLRNTSFLVKDIIQTNESYRKFFMEELSL